MSSPVMRPRCRHHKVGAWQAAHDCASGAADAALVPVIARLLARLGYACQREAPRDHLLRRLRKLDRALGGDGDGWPDAPPDKPKWMRWRTYERKVEAWYAAHERASDAADAALAPIIARLLRTYG